MLRQIGPLDFAALGSQLLEFGKAFGVASRRDHSKASVDGHLESRLTERRGRTADDEQLATLDLKISEQASPGGRIRFGDCGQFRPRQIRIDSRDVRYGRAGVFGIAAVDRTA